MRYGLVGKKLEHSYSKEIHESLGLYDYELLEVPEDDFDDFIKSGDYDGLNVTIPYKQRAAALCDELDPIAKEIGAVNTLYFHGDKLCGANTDYHGFLYMLQKSKIQFAGRSVLILGDGGASKMIQKALADRAACDMTVAGRSDLNAGGSLPLDAQIIINATPVGMYPGSYARVINLREFPSCEGVLDLIYNPAKTDLLLSAEKMDISYAGGLSMLVAQALEAARLFTGKDFSGREDDIYDKILGEKNNIILIGMPGSGKSTIGKSLADKLNREFADCDEAIVASRGMPISEIFKTDGEAAFRRLESKIIRSLCKEHGRVIATGGGSVLNPNNVRAMKSNGTIVYIERELSELATGGRPLSKDADAIKAMAKRRIPLYEKACDISIKNTGQCPAVVDILSEILFF